LKRVMMVGAILALVVVAAVPAIAQLAGGVGQSSESGDTALGADVANQGDYASQCTPVSQFGNTGNFDNGSSFVQYDGEVDDFEPGGIEVGFGGSNSVSCPSTVQQSSAASST
jgi:hypothetical protein